MATYNEQRLQQLLSSFNNRDTNTGITGASNAMPMINGVPMINTGAINKKLQNNDLVSQIIAENEAANANKSQTFLEYDPAFGQLYSNREQDPNDPTNTLYAYQQDSSMLPSYGGVSGYRDVGIPQINNQISQVNSQVPQNFEFLQSAYEDLDEDAAQVDSLPGQKKKLSDMGRNFGISSLLGMITGNPIIGLLSRGAKGLGALNDRMQNSDFGRSNTLADYFDARRYGGIAARDRKASQTMREARGIQKAMDMRGDSTSRVADRDRNSVTESSAAKSKGVGGGGYTASDSTREGFRGR